jgi:hypothetical protein
MLSMQDFTKHHFKRPKTHGNAPQYRANRGPILNENRTFAQKN